VSRARRLLAVALVGAAVLASATVSAGSGHRPEAHAAGEDSPWPRTDAVRANVRAIKSVVRDLSRKVELMELSAARYADWEACIRGVPVSEYGDPDRQWGYLFDERNGFGMSYMPALAVDRKSRPRKEDYLFLSLSRRGNCRSNAPLPGGTADPASVRTTAAASRRPRGRTLLRTLRNLERRVKNMKRSSRRLLAASERFDEWESCVSWVPVTEYGHPDGKFGYLFGGREASPAGYRPALAIDRSDRDDPDYMILALVGGDRPGRTCQDEPGEAID
jgi:hypothetical protein